MRTIIRCPSCFTYVYDDAKACHGCGERVGKRKILRRGSWVLIALIVCAYAAGRGIELQQERKSRVRSELQSAERSRVVLGFVRAWLVGDDAGVASSLAATEGTCKDDIVKLRALYPTVLPATDVVHIKLLDAWEERHAQRNKGSITHVRPKNRPSASCEPLRSSSIGTSRTRVGGKTVVDKSWSLSAMDFEAELKQDGLTYTLYGRVCIDLGGGRDGAKVSCLTLDRVEGPEGTVPVKE
jgi:hypothetical protein